jgi:hypothetical protein
MATRENMGNQVSALDTHEEFKQRACEEIDQLKTRVLHLERMFNEVNDRILKLEKIELFNTAPRAERGDSLM